jgi:thiol-disulfide isomerase/thioredoxin
MVSIFALGFAGLLIVFGFGSLLFWLVTRAGTKQLGSGLGSGESPQLAPARVAAQPSAGKHVVVHLRAGTPLGALLRDHANTAETQGLRPFLEFGATWCPPSRIFGELLDDPRMHPALAGTYLIRSELDDFVNDPLTNELGAVAVPVFYELNADGRSTGRTITGAAWGDDRFENISKTMARFFAG